MSGFRDLADASRDFSASLNQQAQELDLVASITLPPDEAIDKKLKVLNLTNSIQTLVAASVSEVSVQSELEERVAENNNIQESSVNTNENTILNDAFITSIVMSREVKDLFQTSNENLTAAERDCKEELRVRMREQTDLDDQLLVLDESQREKEERLQKLRVEWSEISAKLKQRQSQTSAKQDNSNSTPEREKLKTLVDRMEMMRMLISRLITCKEYDWYNDPHKLVKILPTTREVNTLEQFTE